MFRKPKTQKARFLIPSRPGYQFKTPETRPSLSSREESKRMSQASFRCKSMRGNKYFKQPTILLNINETELYTLERFSRTKNDYVTYKSPYPWLQVFGLYVHGRRSSIPCIFIENKANLRTIMYFHENGCDMFSALNHAMDLSSIMQANVVIMEYPEYGIYTQNDSDSDSGFLKTCEPMSYTRCTTPASKAPSKQAKSQSSILKQIYKDCRTVLKYIQGVGEVIDRRVILYGKGMGAHFALYTAVELKTKFAGIILHNAATVQKKAKYTEEELKTLISFIPTNNLERAEKLTIPTLCIHNSQTETLAPDHCERLVGKITPKFMPKDSFSSDGKSKNGALGPIADSAEFMKASGKEAEHGKRAKIVERLKSFCQFCDNLGSERDPTTSYSDSVAISRDFCGKINHFARPIEPRSPSKFKNILIGPQRYADAQGGRGTRALSDLDGSASMNSPCKVQNKDTSRSDLSKITIELKSFDM